MYIVKWHDRKDPFAYLASVVPGEFKTPEAAWAEAQIQAIRFKSKDHALRLMRKWMGSDMWEPNLFRFVRLKPRSR